MSKKRSYAQFKGAKEIPEQCYKMNVTSPQSYELQQVTVDNTLPKPQPPPGIYYAPEAQFPHSLYEVPELESDQTPPMSMHEFLTGKKQEKKTTKKKK